MIKLIPITVECHSGYASDENPVAFHLEKSEVKISDVADRWYQGDRDPEAPVSNYFKVTAANGVQYILKHELERDKWFLCLSV